MGGELVVVRDDEHRHPKAGELAQQRADLHHVRAVEMPDMQQGGETGRSRGRRMPMQQQGPQDQQDENSSDSNSKSGESDSGQSSTESSDWRMEFFEIA